MYSNITKILVVLSSLMLACLLMAGAVNAQSTPVAKKSAEISKLAASDSNTPKEAAPKKSAKSVPTSQTVGEEAGNYTITSAIEFGARGLRVVGDTNKYHGDLNYSAGARLFDSSFLVKSKDGKGGLFDTLLVTSTGWGADPNGHMRISVEKPEWYRFKGSYRRFEYFRYLNNFANPNWTLGNVLTLRNPNTGRHGYNTLTEFGDFDLTILPKNETIKFTVGYAPERYTGPYFSTYYTSGNNFLIPVNARIRANDFRVGAEGKLGPIDWSFLQGFRRFRDDSFVDTAPSGLNPSPLAAGLTSYTHNEPARGKVDYTRFSLHTLIAKRLDITARIIHSRATSNTLLLENLAGVNWNSSITTSTPAPPAPNVLQSGQINIASNAKRPNTLGDLGLTFLATSKFRFSYAFRVERFEIDGTGLYNSSYTVLRGGIVDTRGLANFDTNFILNYRKFQNTVEGDYQFNDNYSVHFGYRHATRREHLMLTGYRFSTIPRPVTPPLDEIETNQTNAFFGGFKARPVKNWTVYFDAEHGTADNVFTRIGNYNYTKIRAKSRYAPSQKVIFNFAVIARANANPSEISGETVSDFGVDVKSRVLQSSVDWVVNPRLSLRVGYNYNWVNSDAVVDYNYTVVPPLPASRIFHHFGHALYFQRNNFFTFNATARLNRRMTLYTSYRINKDNGQGSRVSDPTGGSPVPGGLIPPGATAPVPSFIGGTLINSYPMSFQSPEARLAIRLNRRLDWNLGYQYYNYNESRLVTTFPGSVRPQNYHAHLPYMSLRLYFGRKE